MHVAVRHLCSSFNRLLRLKYLTIIKLYSINTAEKITDDVDFSSLI